MYYPIMFINLYCNKYYMYNFWNNVVIFMGIYYFDRYIYFSPFQVIISDKKTYNKFKL